MDAKTVLAPAGLDPAHQELADRVERFARAKIAPRSAEESDYITQARAFLLAMAEDGLLRYTVPEAYGGALPHVDIRSLAVVRRILARFSALADTMFAMQGLGSFPITLAGSESLKRKFLPATAGGKSIATIAITEPQAGSDAAGQKTRAALDGDSYVINGTKNFITNGPEAGVCILFANTAPDQGHHGISAFIVETSWPGFQVVRSEDKMGIHGAHSAQLSFSELRVPRQNLLAGEGEGFKVAMKTLDGGRIGIAAQAVGIGRASLEASLKYAQERKTFGNPLASYQAIQWKLADMAVEVDAARLLMLQAAALKDKGLPCTKQSAMAKLFAAETAMKAATEAVQIHGGYGYTKEFKVERYFRDAKITEIYEGTSEIQRLVISSQVLQNR